MILRTGVATVTAAAKEKVRWSNWYSRVLKLLMDEHWNCALEVWHTEDFSLLCSATARRRRTVPSSAASLPASLSSSKTSADGTWRGECLSPSRGEPLRGRRRAHNPTARVGRLQSYTWTSAVESRGGAPSAVTTVKFGGDDRPSVRWNTLIWVSHFFHRVIIRIYAVVGCRCSMTIIPIISKNKWRFFNISWNQSNWVIE